MGKGVQAARDEWEDETFKLVLSPEIKHKPVAVVVTSQSKHVIAAALHRLVRGLANNKSPFDNADVLRAIIELAAANNKGAHRPP